MEQFNKDLQSRPPIFYLTLGASGLAFAAIVKGAGKKNVSVGLFSATIVSSLIQNYAFTYLKPEEKESEPEVQLP
jgi:hypothetical protein